MLAGVFIYLERWDGGSEFGGSTGTVRIAILAVLICPALVSSLFQARKSTRAAVAIWGTGGLIAVSLAMSRSNFPQRAMTLGLMPWCALAAARIVRRRRGADVILALFAISFVIYWSNSFLSWSAGGGAAMWLALSWHNQSGILMAAFALVFLGVATQDRGRIQIPMTVLCAMGIAAALLSSSRGTLISMILGVSVVAIATFRLSEKKARALITGLAVLALSAALAFGLQKLYGFQDAQQTPAANRNETELNSQPVSGAIPRREASSSTFKERLYHWDAAAGMFLSRPASGWGLGSFPDISRRFTSPNGYLTSSPHNEYLQLFAEGGIPLGGIGLVIAGAIGFSCLKIAYYLPRTQQCSNQTCDQRSKALVIGAAAALFAMIVHAGVDFDWSYSVLACLTTTLAGILLSASCQVSKKLRDDTKATWTATAAVIPVAVLLTIGVAGAITENSGKGSPPWDARSRANSAMTGIRDGRYSEAIDTIESARAWNPGLADLKSVEAIVFYAAGKGAPEAIEDTLIPGESSFEAYEMAAEYLIQGGDLASARVVIDQYFDYVKRYPRWATTASRSNAWELRIRLEYQESGCDRARQVAQSALESNSVKETIRRSITEEIYRLCPPQ